MNRFDVASLSKLSAIKDSTGKLSALDFVSKKLKQKFPDLDLKEDLELLRTGARLKLADVEKQVKNLTKLYKDNINKKDIVLRSLTESDNQDIKSILEKFFSSKNEEMDKLQKRFDGIKTLHLEICAYFDMPKTDERAKSIEDFIKFFEAFVSGLWESFLKIKIEKPSSEKPIPAGKGKIKMKVMKRFPTVSQKDSEALSKLNEIS